MIIIYDLTNVFKRTIEPFLMEKNVFQWRDQVWTIRLPHKLNRVTQISVERTEEAWLDIGSWQFAGVTFQ